ncbi:hypothetical protein ACTJKH_17640 [Microbacterium sp. 22215]|uniref:hypothetical protein n=1 Tax=Microbacterium sp. 22215 TaxID=3453893 RepID=UPI003F825927
MDDIERLARAWREVHDGETGHAYGEALEAAGCIDEAAIVYRELADAGFLIGFADLAWLEHERGNVAVSHELLADYLRADTSPDEQTDLIAGVLGHWQWCDDRNFDAESLLRRGADAYPSARADLSHLLRESDREGEAEDILRAGVAQAEVESFLPLANLLEEGGRVDEAVEVLRLGYALGDAFSAYNLSLILDDRDDVTEAREWRWRAAEGGDDKAIEVLSDVDEPPSD